MRAVSGVIHRQTQSNVPTTSVARALPLLPMLCVCHICVRTFATLHSPQSRSGAVCQVAAQWQCPWSTEHYAYACSPSRAITYSLSSCTRTVSAVDHAVAHLTRVQTAAVGHVWHAWTREWRRVPRAQPQAVGTLKSVAVCRCVLVARM